MWSGCHRVMAPTSPILSLILETKTAFTPLGSTCSIRGMKEPVITSRLMEKQVITSHQQSPSPNQPRCSSLASAWPVSPVRESGARRGCRASRCSISRGYALRLAAMSEQEQPLT